MLISSHHICIGSIAACICEKSCNQGHSQVVIKLSAHTICLVGPLLGGPGASILIEVAML